MHWPYFLFSGLDEEATFICTRVLITHSTEGLLRRAGVALVIGFGPGHLAVSHPSRVRRVTKKKVRKVIEFIADFLLGIICGERVGLGAFQVCMDGWMDGTGGVGVVVQECRTGPVN